MEGAPRRRDVVDSGAGGEGVRDLMWAVLLDAILCLRANVGPPKDRQRLALDARVWMASSARTWPFSFESVCDVLGLNASHLRTLLLTSRTSPAGAAPEECGLAEDLMHRLSLARMRGNRRTRVTAKRQYPKRRKNREL